MELKEKAAYLKGLSDGMVLDTETKEGKLIAALIDMVSELADAVEAHDADLDEIVDELGELREYAEELDSDLGDVEDYLDVELDDVDSEDDDDFDWQDDEDDEDDEEEGDYFEIVCPSCGESICFDESVEPENLTCPACGEKFACEIEEDDLKAIDGEDE